jgi:hypothetical protein
MDDDGASSDEDSEEPEDGEVIIKIPREMKERIRAPWSTSFIVKVFGRSVGYLFLVNRLKSLWKPTGGMSCIDLGLGFFLVKLDWKDDFEHILKGGPWFIGEHFLSLRPWVPNFRLSVASVNTMVVWIRLPKLPVEYYDKDSLLKIGNGLGPVLRVDFNTASGARGRFARFCVQPDLDKPLVKMICVGHVRHSVIYEGIGLLCFHCGRVGHKLESCPERISQPSPNCETSKQPEEKEGSSEEVNSFGPWMLVTHWKRQGKTAPALFGLNKMEGSDSPVVNDASYVQKKGQSEGYSKDVGKSGSGSTKGRAKVKGSNKGKAKVGNEPHDSGNAHPIGPACGSSSLANANPNSAQNSFQS